jgi:hypothetical protein
MTVSAVVLEVGAGATAGAAAAGDAVTVSEGALTVAAGAAAVGAAAAGGVPTVSESVLTVAAGAAAAAVQTSEIMFSSVTATLFSAAPAFCPMSFTSWPTCGLRSAVLLVILKIWPVVSSATV